MRGRVANEFEMSTGVIDNGSLCGVFVVEGSWFVVSQW
jgi:hypothetical protein